MKANPEKLDEVMREFHSRVTLHPASDSFWNARAELHIHKGMTQDNALAMLLVEFVSNLIARSLAGTRDKKQSKGGTPDAGGLAVPYGMTWRETMAELIAQGERFKRGKRQPIALSEIDKAEIAGTVSLVLAKRGAFERPLDRVDIGECFRMVEGRDCLNLNRRWRKDPDSEKTLSDLALPSYDMEEENARLSALEEKLERIQACMDAAYDGDKSRQREATRRSMLAAVVAIVKRTHCNGQDLRTKQKQRRNLADYLQAGARALQQKTISNSPWLADIASALDAFTSRVNQYA